MFSYLRHSFLHLHNIISSFCRFVKFCVYTSILTPLIEIIKKINKEVNKQVYSTIGVAPIMLYEKEYFKPLQTTEIIKQYSKESIRVKITNESLFYYKGKKYSVPNKFINTHLDLKEDNNKLDKKDKNMLK